MIVDFIMNNMINASNILIYHLQYSHYSYWLHYSHYYITHGNHTNISLTTIILSELLYQSGNCNKHTNAMMASFILLYQSDFHVHYGHSYWLYYYISRNMVDIIIHIGSINIINWTIISVVHRWPLWLSELLYYLTQWNINISLFV